MNEFYFRLKDLIFTEDVFNISYDNLPEDLVGNTLGFDFGDKFW